MNQITLKSKASWWPKIIIATFIFFALFIGNMVRQAMQSDVDLVSKDYYKNEIAYQQHINKVNATQALHEQVLVNYASAANQISLVFPETINAGTVKGRVQFFRPSDAKLDFELPLQLNSDAQQHIGTQKLTAGLWRIKINWQINSREYYLQKDINL